MTPTESYFLYATTTDAEGIIHFYTPEHKRIFDSNGVTLPLYNPQPMPKASYISIPRNINGSMTPTESYFLYTTTTYAEGITFLSPRT